MERKKLIGLGAVIAVFIAVTAWTVFSIPDAPPVTTGPEKTLEMEYGENVIREEIGGKTLWELTMASSTMDVKTQASTFKDVKGKYYFADGKILTLTAPEGSYDSKTKNVKLKGGVTATTSDEAKLTSKELEWVSGKDRLVATGEVKISQPGMHVEADRIETWNQFQEFRAMGHARLVREQDGKGAKAK
jgi:LPS export ABC transporter protein LptC